MNKLILLILWCLAICTRLWADLSSSPEGVIVLTSATGQTPVSIAFSALTFANFDSGVVTDTNGVKTPIDDRAIGKIVYLNKDYYLSLHGDVRFLNFAGGLRPREILAVTTFDRIVQPGDVQEVQASANNLEYIAEHYPSSKDLLQPQINTLRSYLARCAQSQVFVNGKWISREEFKAIPAEPAIGHGTSKTISFTTKNGKKYVNVIATPTDTGLTVITSDGGATIPFDQLPTDVQSMFGYKPLPTSTIAPKVETLDQKCAIFLQNQVDLSSDSRSSASYPESTSMLVDTVPTPINFSKRPGSRLEVIPVKAGDIVRPEGVINGDFIIPIRARMIYTQIDGISNNGIGLNESSQISSRLENVNGKGLIQICDTTYQSEAETQEIIGSLAKNVKVNRFVTTAPVVHPLFISGRRVGEETLPPGSILHFSSEHDDELFAYKDDPTSTFSVPASSTNWGERFAMINAVRKMYGFVARLNELLAGSNTLVSYNYSAPKRFRISDSQGDYRAFNPEDLSMDRPTIYDQSESTQQDIYLEYSNLRAIGYADNNSAFIAADKTTAGVASHTETTRTTYFVTVETKNNENLLETSEVGDIQKRQLIFKIFDRSEATELADLLYDFCNQFSAPSNDASVIPTPTCSPPPDNSSYRSNSPATRVLAPQDDTNVYISPEQPSP